MTYSQQHLDEAAKITSAISAETIEAMVQLLRKVKEEKEGGSFLA
jgi:Mn-dependent DtxR family transcriptional regulator